jgi:hypothetical protein
MSELPYIDTQTVAIGAPAQVVFETLEGAAPGLMGGRLASAYARLVGTADRGSDGAPVGFHVVHREAPNAFVLSGRHRFARYELAFRIEGDDGVSTLHADTRAEFPGIAGRLYRAAVIGTGGHVVAVRRMLSAIKRRAEQTAS